MIIHLGVGYVYFWNNDVCSSWTCSFYFGFLVYYFFCKRRL